MQHENIHIAADIIINASREKLWDTLSDLPNWPRWTSLMVSARGNFGKDEKLTLEFVNPAGGSIVFERTMFLFEPGKAFGWTGDAFAGLKDFHIFELEALDENHTKLIQSDGLHGADVPGIAEMEQQMLAGYQIFNQELKAFAEAQL